MAGGRADTRRLAAAGNHVVLQFDFKECIRTANTVEDCFSP